MQIHAIKVSEENVPRILNTSEQTGVTPRDTDVMMEFVDQYDRVFLSYLADKPEDNTWGTMRIEGLKKSFHGDLTGIETGFVRVVRKD